MCMQQYIVVRTYNSDSPGKENLLGFDDMAAWTVATILLVNTSFFLLQMCHTSDLGKGRSVQEIYVLFMFIFLNPSVWEV